MPVDTFLSLMGLSTAVSPLILPDTHSPLVFSSWLSLCVFLWVFLPCFLWGFPAMLPLGAGVSQGSMLNLQLFPLVHGSVFVSRWLPFVLLSPNLYFYRFRPFAELQVCVFSCLLTILSGFLKVHSNQHVKYWAYLYLLPFLHSVLRPFPYPN